MGRQIQYFVLPSEFAELVATVGRPEAIELVPQEQSSKTMRAWAIGDPPPISAWLIRRKDLSRMQSEEPWWWDARKSWVVSAGAFGLEMGGCFFDGRALTEARIYFNTLPPVDPEVEAWARRAMSAARKWLLRRTADENGHPLKIYCGPQTAAWFDESHPMLHAGKLILPNESSVPRR